MAKTILNEVFEAVREMGLTRTESEFSVDWLGRSECYMRTLRFENQPPSIATIAICASKLQHFGERMVRTDKYKREGSKFLALSEQCHKAINADAEATWLDTA